MIEPSARRAAARLAPWSAPLFVQVLSLVLLCLVATEAISLGILFSLPPPAPELFRASEVALAFQHNGFSPRDGPGLVVHPAKETPDAAFIGRPYTRETLQDIARRLSANPNDVVMVAPPKGSRFWWSPAWVMRERPRGGLPHADPILVAPFQIGWKGPDGVWRVVQPREPFPNAWQQRILLWFVLSALALSPVAYWFARRLAAPISAFARAAERLGRDPGAPPLEAAGPAEIGQAVQAFNLMQDRLRRYVEDRTEMVGAVAHDLRTPLTRLRFRVENAPEPLRQKMAADIDQMDAMISATLAFVRDASHPGPRCRLELASLVECVADEMAETGLEVSAEVGPPVVIEGDPVGLRRLVTNLLDNAVKFGDRARARVYADAGSAVIEVDDDGPGVPENERERVFEPFHRGEPSRSRETGGAGLGLAVVRSVARAHGGDAVLDNRPDGGLRASARLPL